MIDYLSGNGPARAFTSVHVPARFDQRCLSLIAAWPVNPALASGRGGRRLESGHPTRNCQSLDRLSGHTERRPSWAVARPWTRARFGRESVDNASGPASLILR